MPIMIARLFGEQATMIYGCGFSFSGVSSLVTSLLVTFAFDGDFESCYYIGSGMCVVSLLILIFLFKDLKVM